MSEKLDLLKLHKQDYTQSRKPGIFRPSIGLYLSYQGTGSPGGEVFTQAIGALYAMAFTIKMTEKFEKGRDYKVSKIEGIWWGTENPCGDYSQEPKDQWNWKLMIRVPEFIGEDQMKGARKQLEEKGKDPAFRDVLLIELDEGEVVQMLHLGPYEKEGETIVQMLDYAESEGYEIAGCHHDIYLSDPRRAKPERLKTIVRFPVRIISS
ncbi:MAG: GyrI-like domain-containing protein [Candidatus Krumholzibacteria bacterium]|jgi:hypothetical protein|nr:GyrI-like domain-containing protein [Candidatus Krumholzibacteria bacterium]MDP6668348.1 GyrI-like domain-containing protein [Candidatus Krumholzibacteria bacterium]MDP6796387.1 GyrI-like domain-containing protein [Candidatus Krumholzibacteria bacterium]MDP7022199.1 GyrI-like domain-containing protein [Candidatus Krumholzibacteria bacterium]